MRDVINEAILPMINDGLISVKRTRDLIGIKEFIDRVSTRKYIEERDAAHLFTRYGVMPSIITWGDYFQTDLASSLQVLSDQEFEKVLDTVRFDIMSSHMIFSGKDKEFFTWVEDTHVRITIQPTHEYSEEEEEILHLKILMDYYVNMGIIDQFTEAEKQWYSSYRQAMAV
jgi:hypothetical protein